MKTLKKTLKKILYLMAFPFVSLWRVLKWSFRRIIPSHEKSEIEKIAEIIPEGIPCKYDDRPIGFARHYSFNGCLEYSKYKEYNSDDLITIKSWSFDPIVYSRDNRPRYARKVFNRWRWRMGLYTPEEIEGKNSD